MLISKSSCQFSLTSLHINASERPQSLSSTSSNSMITNHKGGMQRLRFSVSSKTRLQKNYKIKRNVVLYSSVEPGPSFPSNGPPSNSLNWIIAIVTVVVLPFISYKWGPSLKNKVDIVLRRTEDVVEAVEKVAEEVEKVAEDIADDLPKGGKFRKAVDFIENVAETTAKDAHLIDEFIDKVEEEEKKIGSPEFADDKARDLPEEGHDIDQNSSN